VCACNLIFTAYWTPKKNVKNKKIAILIQLQHHHHQHQMQQKQSKIGLVSHRIHLAQKAATNKCFIYSKHSLKKIEKRSFLQCKIFCNNRLDRDLECWIFFKQWLSVEKDAEVVIVNRSKCFFLVLSFLLRIDSVPFFYKPQ
jgi:hypothetical protein